MKHAQAFHEFLKRQLSVPRAVKAREDSFAKQISRLPSVHFAAEERELELIRVDRAVGVVRAAHLGEDIAQDSNLSRSKVCLVGEALALALLVHGTGGDAAHARG